MHMSESISRRSFIKSSALLGASTILGTGTMGSVFADVNVDIAAVKGTDYFGNTIKAVEILGGMAKFVSKQSNVGLLVNSPWKYPGSYVNPEITLAVIRMCLDAGAKEIWVFKNLDDSYWSRSARTEKSHDAAKIVRFRGDEFVTVSVPQGRSLKKAEIAKGLLDCDVLINVPIAKNHNGVRFTGTMKNMMGATSRGTNRFFHSGSGAAGFYDDVEFLSQCIADVNLLRKPDLCIFDATQMIATNGPQGPGKMVTPQKVFAGVDRVALDVYGANLLGIKGEEVRTTRMAYEFGLGKINLSSLQIQEISIDK